MVERGAKRQYLATLVVSLYVMGTGIFQGWSQMENHYYIDSVWLFQLGGLIGTIFFGFIAMKFGRKISLQYSFILITISCLLNLFVGNFVCFHISILLAGIFDGALLNTAPLYLAEIAEIGNVRFRGAMLSSLALAVMAGEFVALIGTIFERNFATLCSIIPIIAIAAISFHYLPDTPLYFIKRNDEKKAEESIRFYKNIRKTDAHQLETLEELAKVKNIAADGEIEANQMIPLRWADFKTEHARKALKIGIVLVLLSTCNGLVFIQYYTTMAFEQAGLGDLTISKIGIYIHLQLSNMSVLSVFAITFVAKLGAMQMVDHLGRKVLMMSSAIGAATGFLAYSMYIIPSTMGFETEFWLFNWIPLISTLWIIFFLSLGIQSLTFTIITEIMPEKIKDVGLTFCGALHWVLTFLNFVLFRIAFAYLGMGYAVVSAIICLTGAIYVHFKVPETKGKSHQEIIKSF